MTASIENVFITTPPATETATNTGIELDLLTSDLDEDIARICDLRLEVDDDREPAPENLSTVN